MKKTKLLFRLLVITLAAFGAYQLLPNDEAIINVFYETPLDKHLQGVVGFPSFNAKSGKDFKNGGATAVHQTSGGILTLPISASNENQVPAVVILHGSGGDWAGRSVNLAMYLADRGIAALAVDTFVARNLLPTDDYFTRLEKAPIFTQMADAMSALKALQNHPYIDKQRIGVTGMSLGAGATLYMMHETVIENVLGKDGPRFSAYAMFYGGCSVDFDDWRVQGGPLLIMMGELDESMSIDGCKQYQKKLEAMDVDVDLVVYKGAGHGWDNPYPQHFVEKAAITKNCLMHWKDDGENIEQSTGHSVDSSLGAVLAFSSCSSRDGYTMGYNDNAFKQSRNDLMIFLSKVWQL
jgi:dienelactone hydrolase